MTAIQSTLLIPVLNIEPVVGKWRKQYQSSALRGIPPHITLLFPFLHPQQINDTVIDELHSLFREIKKFRFTLTKLGTFPNIIFLEPSSRVSFIEITKKIMTKYNIRPYEGLHPKINPHLTLAMLSATDDFEGIFSMLEKDLSSQLPLDSVVEEAWLMEKDEKNYWHVRTKFPFSRV